MQWLLSIFLAFISASGFLLAYAKAENLTLSSSIYLDLAVFVFLLGVLKEYTEKIKPRNRFKNLSDEFLNLASLSLFNCLEKNIDPVRFNLMIPRRRLLSGFQRRLEIVWQRGMDDQPDVAISLPIGHGVVGKCFTNGKPEIADVKKLQSGSDYKLGDRWKEVTKDLTLIVSYPVYTKKVGTAQKDKRVGVLTFDSSSPSACDIFFDASTRGQNFRKKVDELMRGLTEFIRDKWTEE